MNMNQSEFAAHAGVGRRFVSELESGKPSLEFDRVMACVQAAGIDLTARLRSR
jgi:transcriptional regulator with XRE-family HTH domain